MNKKYRTLVIVAATFIITMVVLMLVLGNNNYEDLGYTMYGHMIGGWAMPFGILGMGFFWVFIIYVVVYGFRHYDLGDTRSRNALEVLNKRLANGEITIEEYEAIKEKIKKE